MQGCWEPRNRASGRVEHSWVRAVAFKDPQWRVPPVSIEIKLTCQVMGWLSNNAAPHFVRATATGFEIAFANCAAFVATFIYLSKDAPACKLGHSINIG